MDSPPSTSVSPKTLSPNLGRQTATFAEEPPLHTRLPHIALPEDTGSLHGRRQSVQFIPAGAHLPKGEPKLPKPSSLRRFSSPPPPETFQRRIAFDTFDNKDATEFSLCLSCKHRDYHHSRRSRTFMCGLNKDEYSEYALEWLIDELVDDGDEIVCLRIVDENSKMASTSSIRDEKYRQEARKMMDHIVATNTEQKAISIVLEFAVGKVPSTIQRMIQVYEPAILVVGTKGRNLVGIQGLLPGSVSKYCLQHSPVPVIVVRPEEKREERMKKREKLPRGKGTYMDILKKSGVKGQATHILDKDNRDSIVPELPAASNDEAAAVAAAVRLSLKHDSHQVTGAGSRRGSLARSDTGDDGAKSPGFGPRSPASQREYISPNASDSERDDESEDEDRLEAIPGGMLATHDVASDEEDEADDRLKLERTPAMQTAAENDVSGERPVKEESS